MILYSSVLLLKREHEPCTMILYSSVLLLKGEHEPCTIIPYSSVLLLTLKNKGLTPQYCADVCCWLHRETMILHYIIMSLVYCLQHWGTQVLHYNTVLECAVAHIGEHGLAMLGDHGRLLTVQTDGGVVKRLLGVL